jgi:YhcH/YjgK/YiaL family protein
MIADRLENSHLYNCLGKRFEQAFRYLREMDFSNVPHEKIELDGASLFALPQQYQSKLRETGLWEAHRKYVDIQYIVSGTEQMGISNVQAMRVTQEYDAEKDFMLLDGPGQFLNFSAGSFAIFMPHDAHMPGIAASEPESVLKVVMKVAV